MKKEVKNSKNYQKLICLVVFSLFFINFIYAKTISSESITSITEDLDTEFAYNKIQKIYEISDSSLKKGYSTLLNEKDAFRINIVERNYYLIVWNISGDEVKIIFPNNRELIFEIGDIILVDMNQDNKLDIQLELKSIEEDYENAKITASVKFEDETTVISNIQNTPHRQVNFYIKQFIEEELIPEGGYFELFDVTVRLADEQIYTSRDLEAFIIFENFGEGTSEINIVYSIIDEKNKEVYRGIDSKVVQTEDRVVKDFDFLNLPLGKYILRTEIFYGNNQTGDAEQDFEIVKIPFWPLLSGPLIFILIIIGLFVLVVFGRKTYNSKKNVKNKMKRKNEKTHFFYYF